MKYDDASWHYGGEFPAELPQEAGATHIGMFLSWCLLSGLGGEFFALEFPAELEGLRQRQTTPGAFLLNSCDEKFIDEWLSEEGNRFATAYYQGDPNPYLTDYEMLFLEKHPALYDVPDTWESFEKLRPVLDYRLESWRQGTLDMKPPGFLGGKKWWQLW
jgi:hypothetical protein